MNDTFQIPESNMWRFEHRLAKLNKRAAKLGCPAITFTQQAVELRHEYINAEDTHSWATMEYAQECEARGYKLDLTGRAMKWLTIQVTGETPKYNGWTFLAVVEQTTEGNLLRKVPGVEADLSEYRDSVSHCDHCNLERRRKETFVVEHEDGVRKQVGRQCIKDFLGHEDPKTIAAQAELMFSLREMCESESEWEEGGCRERQEYVATDAFLSHVAMNVRLEARYVTRKMADEDMTLAPTADLAMSTMFPPKGHRAEVPKPEERDVEMAEAALTMVEERLGGRDDLSDFEHNMLVLAKTEAFHYRNKGMVAYIIGWYKRETEEAKANEGRLDAYFGEIKKRYKAVEVRYVGGTSWDGLYGVTYLYRFLTAEGHTLVWKTGDNIDWQEEPFKLTFTVKAHEEYKGKKQTYINRAVSV